MLYHRIFYFEFTQHWWNLIPIEDGDVISPLTLRPSRGRSTTTLILNRRQLLQRTASNLSGDVCIFKLDRL